MPKSPVLVALPTVALMPAALMAGEQIPAVGVSPQVVLVEATEGDFSPIPVAQNEVLPLNAGAVESRFDMPPRDVLLFGGGLVFLLVLFIIMALAKRHEKRKATREAEEEERAAAELRGVPVAESGSQTGGRPSVGGPPPGAPKAPPIDPDASAAELLKARMRN